MAAYKDASSAGVPGSNSTFQMNTFVPTMWSSRILKNLHDKQVLANLCTREYEGEIRGAGDTVKIHSVGNITVNDYLTNLTSGDAVTYALPTDAEKLLEIDTAKYFAFKVEDIETAQSNPKFMSELSAEAAIAMAKTVDDYLYNKMLDAAKGAGGGSASSTEIEVTTGTAANVYNALVDAGVRLDDNLCPDDGRFVVMPAFAKGALLKDDRFVAYNSAGQAGMRDKGLLGTVAGFEVYTLPKSTFDGRFNTIDTNAVADLGVVTGSTADDYSAIFGRKGAMAYAEQLAKVENIRLEGFFADAVRGLHLFGAAAIRPSWLGVLEMDDPYTTDA